MSSVPFGGRPVLDKSLFMHNVCSCLDSCSQYVQSLNSLCAAGTVLAHSLLQVFQELPPYRDIADQFVHVWEELSKATAGASSGVKTETLMTLQEVLTRLEEESSEGAEGNSYVADNIRAVGSCLLSYVELQAKFSLTCWKSLSQLSDAMTSDSLFFFCLPPRHHSSSSLESSASLFQPPASLNGFSSYSHRVHELVLSIQNYYSRAVCQTTNLENSLSNVNPKMTVNTSNAFSHQTPPPGGGCIGSNQQNLSSSAENYCFQDLSSWSQILVSNQKNLQAPTMSNNYQEKDSPSDIPNDLEEVLHLLSCQPSDYTHLQPNLPTSLEAYPIQALNPSNTLPLHQPLKGSDGEVSPNGAFPSDWSQPKEMGVTVSDSAIHKGKGLCQYEGGKRTWPRMGGSSSGDLPGDGAVPSSFGFGSWFWGLQDGDQQRMLSILASQGHQAQEIVNRSSQNGNVAWISSSSRENANRWSSAQGENNSSSDDGSSYGGNLQEGAEKAPSSTEVFSLGLDLAGLVISHPSNRQRRHSSNDGFPEGCHLDQKASEEESASTLFPWETIRVAKVSTWPLKQGSGLLSEPSPSISGPGQSLSISNAGHSRDTREASSLQAGRSWSTSSSREEVGDLIESEGEKKYTLFGQIS